MINIRYHIISLTAVFLALGIGLTIGSTFFANVNVQTLKDQVDTVEDNIREEQARNGELSDRVGRLEDRDAALADALPERLLKDRLGSVPVLLVATRGTDEDLVEEATRSLEAAGAELAGTWWLTERWSLDDDDEVQELGALLELDTTDPDRLRRSAASRLAEVLADAALPAPTSEVEGPPDVAPAEPTEPELVGALEDAGFIDYEARPGSGDDRVLLAPADVRYAMVSGTAPGAGDELMLVTLLDEITSDGVSSVVAAQGEVDLQDEDGPLPEDERRTSFVGDLRGDEAIADNLSTIDDLDLSAGLAALVLALEDLDDGVVGHYGVGPGAARLLPGPEPAP